MRFIPILAVLAVLVTGCESQGEKLDRIEQQVREDSREARERTSVVKVPLPDGRSVLCVTYDNEQRGGISCDWSGHRGESKFK